MCLGCNGEVLAPADPRGTAGASALHRAEELESRAVSQARQKWGDGAAAVAAKIAADDPTSHAWRKGGNGESRLAAYIERELGESVCALHDRVIPGTRKANIDHVFVAASGVWVVDAKTYSGRIERRDDGPLWREDNQIIINGRNRTKLAEGLSLQMKAVRAALEVSDAPGGVSVFAALCFLDVAWPPFLRAFDVHGVAVLYPGALRKRLAKAGPLDEAARQKIWAALASCLPPADA